MSRAQQTVLHVGFDDTDSDKGMCTTFLAYRIVRSLCGRDVQQLQQQQQQDRSTTKFLDFPRLVRFNPNVPWKTRGNGAVSFVIKTNDPDNIKKKIIRMVVEHSDIAHGANPGLVFLEGAQIPSTLIKFSRLALWQLIARNQAKKIIHTEEMLEGHSNGGNGQGLIGALGAIGYDFSADHTLELLSYRKQDKIGTKREISASSVENMQRDTFPFTFNSFDPQKKRVLVAPHGPDPVLYGIRGEDAKTLVHAAHMIKSEEVPEGYLIFKSNQGTGDHLVHELDVHKMTPFTSGVISGIVSTIAEPPRVQRGGHVRFTIDSTQGAACPCAVYAPTGISGIASKLTKGDRVRVGGGVRRATRNHSRVLNVEFLEVLELAPVFIMTNPRCIACNKNMKSKGRNQGYQCIRCKASISPTKTKVQIPRKIQTGMYIPAISAQRHLTRPVQRLNKRNQSGSLDWDTLDMVTAPWLHIYEK